MRKSALVAVCLGFAVDGVGATNLDGLLAQVQFAVANVEKCPTLHVSTSKMQEIGQLVAAAENVQPSAMSSDNETASNVLPSPPQAPPPITPRPQIPSSPLPNAPPPEPLDSFCQNLLDRFGDEGADIPGLLFID